MNTTIAIAIVSSLANGVDPATGAVYPAESPYQQPDVIRALYVALRALEKTKHREPRDNIGKPWTEEQDTKLRQMFDDGHPPTFMAQALGRTVLGIGARLERLGLAVKQS